MANCPKCNAVVEHPLKTWKIKQTPIALYECPSCKSRWRSKLIVEAAVVTPVSTPQTAAIDRIEVKTPVSMPLAAAPSVSARSSGIRRFFSSIFGP